MASISASTPLAESGFSDFCLAAPPRSRATVTMGVNTLPFLTLFLFPLLADLPVACCVRGRGGGRKSKGKASAGGSAAAAVAVAAGTLPTAELATSTRTSTTRTTRTTRSGAVGCHHNAAPLSTRMFSGSEMCAR